MVDCLLNKIHNDKNYLEDTSIKLGFIVSLSIWATPFIWMLINLEYFQAKGWVIYFLIILPCCAFGMWIIKAVIYLYAIIECFIKKLVKHD